MTSDGDPELVLSYREQFTFVDRAIWLVVLLMIQSSGSAIMHHYEKLLMKHPSIVFFSTMLVGAGGNAGGQSVVYVVRQLARGRRVENLNQVATTLGLGVVVGLVAAIRFSGQYYAYGWPAQATAWALSFATLWVVVVGGLIGLFLPQLFTKVGIDPAHATATLQVLTDITSLLTICMLAAGSGRLNRATRS
eukprot:g9793.t1